MKICYVSGGVTVPSVRFRLPFFKMLNERGHRCTILHSHPTRYDYFPLIGWRASQAVRKSIRFWHHFRIQFSRFDAVVLETGMFHTADSSFEERLRKVASRLIYEIDDAVFLLFPEKCERLAKMADHVIAGNESIADWAVKLNSNVSVIPTCVDETVYTAKGPGSCCNDRPVVGWIGSRGNLPMLNIVSAPIRRLAKEIDFELRLVTSRMADRRNLDLAGINVKWIDIDRCNVVSELQEMDIGIMPLDHKDPWMHFKCNAKMIQYMSVGVPAVGTSIGFNRSLIVHGKNGLLAANDDEWETNLRQLLVSADFRNRLGNQGRETVHKSFTVQSQIDRYERALRP